MPRRINGANLLRIVDGANLPRPHTRAPPALAAHAAQSHASARAYAAAAAGELQPAHIKRSRESSFTLRLVLGGLDCEL